MSKCDRLGTMALERGDALVAFTDGISEAMNADDQEWGEERLMEAIVSRRALGPGDLIRSIMGEADSFVGGAPQHDARCCTVRVKVQGRCSRSGGPLRYLATPIPFSI